MLELSDSSDLSNSRLGERGDRAELSASPGESNGPQPPSARLEGSTSAHSHSLLSQPGSGSFFWKIDLKKNIEEWMHLDLIG